MFRRICAVLALVVLAGCGSDAPGPGPAPTTSPAAPRLAEDYAQLGPLGGVVDDAPGRRELERGAAQLTGPHFSFSVAATASVTGALPAGVAKGLRLAAGTTVPDGHQLVLAEIASPASGARTGYADGVTIAVSDGTTERPVRGGPTALSAGTLAVVLPAGAKPVLQVTDEGRTQSLDLTTGRRGRDAVAGYYPVRRGEWEADSGTVTGLRLYGAAVAAKSTQERLAAVDLDDMPVSLLPWDARRGWAKPGRAWLVVGASVGYSRPGADLQDPDVVVVPPASFVATGPAGRIPLSGAPIRIGGSAGPGTVPAAGSGTTLVGDVPASLRQVTVAFTFRGTITTPAGPVTYEPYTNATQIARITIA